MTIASNGFWLAVLIGSWTAVTASADQSSGLGLVHQREISSNDVLAAATYAGLDRRQASRNSPSFRYHQTTHSPSRRGLHLPRVDCQHCGRSRISCQLGFGCIEPELSSPRSWYFQDDFRRQAVMRVVERRELLFDDHFYRPIWRLSGDIYRDHKHFYSADTMSLLGLAVGLHAVLANTPLDEEFRDAVQRNAQHNPDALVVGQYLGETWIVLPGIVAIWGLDELLERSFSWRHPCGRCVGDWARQSGRAFIVGAPITGVLQVGIGASRPGESSAGSRWKPFDDNNGASGHAFVGAVPFLIAAKQVDNPLLKSTLLLGSGFTALSRIYEDKHYLSQALLGYWIAHLAVEATHKTESSAFQYRLVPLGLNGQFGLGLELRY